MASSAAQSYFNTFSPEDQERIRQSWGGQDLMEDWFQNAKSAGAVTGGPTGSGKNWWEMTPEEAGIQAWGAEIGGSNVITANMTPEQRARWSMEHIDALDYRDRKSAYDQWMAWQDSYDANCPPDRPYRAEDGSGCVEKPDNSNKGYMEAGIMDENGNWTPGGRKDKDATQSSDAAYFGQDDPLQRYLTNMLADRGGYMGAGAGGAGQGQAINGMQLQGGGIFWTPNQATAPAPAAPAPASNQAPQAAPPDLAEAAQSAQSAFAQPYTPQVTGGTGTGSAVAPMFMGGPQRLEDMMTRRGQKMSRSNPSWGGSWF